MTLQQTTSITKSVSSLQIQPLSPPKPILPQKLKKVNFYLIRILNQSQVYHYCCIPVTILYNRMTLTKLHTPPHTF